jgi:hypothetical protein
MARKSNMRLLSRSACSGFKYDKKSAMLATLSALLSVVEDKGVVVVIVAVGLIDS